MKLTRISIEEITNHFKTPLHIMPLFEEKDIKAIAKLCCEVAQAQLEADQEVLDKIEKEAQEKVREIEIQTIKKLLAVIEEHGLDKVLALRDTKQEPFNFASLSDPLEVRGKGKGV